MDINQEFRHEAKNAFIPDEAAGGVYREEDEIEEKKPAPAQCSIKPFRDLLSMEQRRVPLCKR